MRKDDWAYWDVLLLCLMTESMTGLCVASVGLPLAGSLWR